MRAHRAFHFWSEHDSKRRWTACHPNWQVVDDHFDFRIDGGERTIWLMPDGTEQVMVAHVLDIAPEARIVYADATRVGGQPISSSLVTVEFAARPGGTVMTFTEQAVFRRADDGASRESGTGGGFDRLRGVMEAEREARAGTAT